MTEQSNIKELPISFNDPYIKGLACAAIESGLRQILLFDADFTIVESTVQILKCMLESVNQLNVKVVKLAFSFNDDNLWGNFAARPCDRNDKKYDAYDFKILWQDGLLTQNRKNDYSLLVVIPDLSQLSLIAARSCIMLMDSPIAHLERHNQHDKWQPQICWLAACDRDKIGRITSHLLDRFALRLSPTNIHKTKESTDIISWLNSEITPIPDSIGSYKFKLPDELKKILENTKQKAVEIKTEVLKTVFDYIPNIPNSSIRRDIALTRLGCAIARLEGSSILHSVHIEKAANLIGLSLKLGEETEVTKKASEDEIEKKTTKEPQEKYEVQEITPEITTDQSTKPKEKEIIKSEPEKIPGDVKFNLLSPYPEDEAPIEHESFPLRLPLRQYSIESNQEKGTIIGTQPANNLSDLALVETIIESAMFQKVRHLNRPNLEKKFLFSPSDLRRYRRIPEPDHILILLIDYTSIRDCQWQTTILPYLRWAYVSRASINIVQVGVENAINELRAQKIAANSLLTPRIAFALEAKSGRATPLAHGLELIRQLLQKIQQRGGNSLQQTKVVIITDGRGNVPLISSQMNSIKYPINREGIDDSLKTAKEIRKFKRIQTTFLDPQPQYHSELPMLLAEELGANRELIPLIEEAQI